MSNKVEGICILNLSLVTSVTATIEAVATEKRSFRVRCTSTGGRALRMSVNGPRSFLKTGLSNIQAVGTPMRMGNDSYTATTKTLNGGNSGQFYNCTASNGVSSLTDSVELTGDASVLLYIMGEDL